MKQSGKHLDPRLKCNCCTGWAQPPTLQLDMETGSYHRPCSSLFWTDESNEQNNTDILRSVVWKYCEAKKPLLAFGNRMQSECNLSPDANWQLSLTKGLHYQSVRTKLYNGAAGVLAFQTATVDQWKLPKVITSLSKTCGPKIAGLVWGIHSPTKELLPFQPHICFARYSNTGRCCTRKQASGRVSQSRPEFTVQGSLLLRWMTFCKQNFSAITPSKAAALSFALKWNEKLKWMKKRQGNVNDFLGTTTGRERFVILIFSHVSCWNLHLTMSRFDVQWTRIFVWAHVYQTN